MSERTRPTARERLLTRAATPSMGFVAPNSAQDAAELEALGVRGSRTDESIPLLRQFWTAEPVTHSGRHHRYTDVRIHPAPAQAGGPPIIVTGRQPVAMRRAAALGDGWMPYLYSPARYSRS